MIKIPNQLSTIHLVILLSFMSVAYAEVVLDGTLGTKGALPGSHFLIEDKFGKGVILLFPVLTLN